MTYHSRTALCRPTHGKNSVNNVRMYHVRRLDLPSSGVTQNAAKLPAAKPEINDT